MSKSPTIENAATIVPVRDVAATLAFYEEVLGFEPRALSDDRTHAIVGHGAAEIHLQETKDAQALRATATNIAIYLSVQGVDRLYDQLKARLDALPKGRVRPPFDQAYGMREFHVKDPDGCLLFFGESL